MIHDLIPGAIRGLLPNVIAHHVVACCFVSCGHGVSVPTFRRQIGASMKRIDAVREQTARWRRGRAFTRFQRGLGFKWRSNGVLAQNAATVCFFDIMQGAQIISDISDVDDEVDGAQQPRRSARSTCDCRNRSGAPDRNPPRP